MFGDQKINMYEIGNEFEPKVLLTQMDLIEIQPLTLEELYELNRMERALKIDPSKHCLGLTVIKS